MSISNNINNNCNCEQYELLLMRISVYYFKMGGLAL